ncbi:ATP-binding cassette domain-containing protein [Micromonospora craniellae]|uniref:ATP-binding cassette domain-containing protein n=1 Tax=Micromonospora craniellae TaxID=2294034 RepID=UPI001CC53750|nr:ATP-binding cassette domain-containing protein [Micromonospora craniellae]
MRTPPPRRARTTVLTALALVAAAGLTACGGSASGDDDTPRLRIGYQRFGGLSLVKARGEAPDAEWSLFESGPVLTEVGLADRHRAWPAELSGGQAQRVAVARALVREPDVLLLDEPFGALDALTRLRMQALLRRLRAEHGFAALLVTHDVEEALLLADRLLLLESGVIAEELSVPLGPTRTPDDLAFGALRRRLLDRLGVPT